MNTYKENVDFGVVRVTEKGAKLISVLPMKEGSCNLTFENYGEVEGTLVIHKPHCNTPYCRNNIFFDFTPDFTRQFGWGKYFYFDRLNFSQTLHLLKKEFGKDENFNRILELAFEKLKKEILEEINEKTLCDRGIGD